jgi:hypothetical protein
MFSVLTRFEIGNHLRGRIALDTEMIVRFLLVERGRTPNALERR